MAEDFRIKAGLVHNKKFGKLIAANGPEALLWLLRLWASLTLEDSQDGLIGDEADVDFLTGTQGACTKLYNAGWLDEAKGKYYAHDWAENQPWVVRSKQRKVAALRANEIRWSKRLGSNPESEPESESDADRSPPFPPPPFPSSPKKKKKSIKKKSSGDSLCPQNWQPSDEDRAKLAKEAMVIDLDREAQKMIDWSHGSNKKKKRWSSVFRNWVRNAYERMEKDGSTRETFRERDERITRERQREAAQRIFGFPGEADN